MLAAGFAFPFSANAAAVSNDDMLGLLAGVLKTFSTMLSQQQQYTAAASIPLGGGSPNTIAAANNINQLSNVQITNPSIAGTLSISNIPDLSSLYLPISGGTISGSLIVNNATSTNFFSTTASSTDLFAAKASFGSLSLASALQVASGGIGTTTWQTGSIPFFNGSSFTENNANFGWDGAHNALRIATSSAGTANALAIGGAVGGGSWIRFCREDSGFFCTFLNSSNGAFNFSNTGNGFFSWSNGAALSGGNLSGLATQDLVVRGGMVAVGTTTNNTATGGHFQIWGRRGYASYFQITNADAGDTVPTGDVFIINGNGNVGVGTSSPSARLTVQGPDAASTTAFSVVNSAGTTAFAVYDNGNATYYGSIFQSSDQRLKTNITSLDASSSLSLLQQLNPVSYNRIDQPGTGENLGFIAQQVAAVFPELVSTTSPTALTPDGTLTLNYEGLIAPIVASIQSLYQGLASLQNTVAGFAESFTTQQLTFTRASGSEVDTQKLCIGKTCITESQLQTMLQQANQTPAPQVQNAPAQTDASSSPDDSGAAATTTSDDASASTTDDAATSTQGSD